MENSEEEKSTTASSPRDADFLKDSDDEQARGGRQRFLALARPKLFTNPPSPSRQLRTPSLMPSRSRKRLKKASNTVEGGETHFHSGDAAGGKLGRRSGSDEVGNKIRYSGNNSGSGGRPSPPSPSSASSTAAGARASANSSSSRGRMDDSRSPSRSRSRSGSESRSHSERPPRSPNLFERLKAEWGKERWQDFDLLQANVLGPGMKGFGSGLEKGGVVGKVSTTEADSDMEMEQECNCVPVGGSNAPTCYDDSCHNYATMQECREGHCHPGCRNQRIQTFCSPGSAVYPLLGMTGNTSQKPGPRLDWIARNPQRIITYAYTLT